MSPRSARAAPDVIVIGAGVVGAACAEALTREGVGVLVLDAGCAGGGTTAAGMGHVVVMDDSPAQLALSTWSREWWGAHAAEMPASCEDVRAGTLWIAEQDREMDEVRAKQARYARAGVASEVLDARALAAAEPALRSGLAGALLVPDDRIIYPPAAARWLLARAAARGAQLRERCTVLRVERGGVVIGDAEGETRIACGAVVNAAGIDAPRLTPGLPIVPRKGHLVITERGSALCRYQLAELGYLTSAHTMTAASTACNLQPRITGQTLIGSSRELVGRDGALNRKVLAEMVARAIGFVPALARATAIRTWTGFRPATPDNLPLIGAWPAGDGLWIAAGHEGLGITTAPATGAIIAAGITGRAAPMDHAPFDPARAMPARSAA